MCCSVKSCFCWVISGLLLVFGRILYETIQFEGTLVNFTRLRNINTFKNSSHFDITAIISTSVFIFVYPKNFENSTQYVRDGCVADNDSVSFNFYVKFYGHLIQPIVGIINYTRDSKNYISVTAFQMGINYDWNVAILQQCSTMRPLSMTYKIIEENYHEEANSCQVRVECL